MILLPSDALGRNGVEVLLAEDDADTLIVKTASRYGLARDVAARVEDNDVVCLLIHHCLKTNYSLFKSTKAGTYDIKSIRANLLPKQTEHILFSHSFAGCDTVTNIFGIRKVKILKKLNSKTVLLRKSFRHSTTSGQPKWRFLKQG